MDGHPAAPAADRIPPTGRLTVTTYLGVVARSHPDNADRADRIPPTGRLTVISPLAPHPVDRIAARADACVVIVLPLILARTVRALILRVQWLAWMRSGRQGPSPLRAPGWPAFGPVPPARSVSR